MAGMGPPPSENKVRRNADTFASDRTTVTPDGRTRGPALKDEWHPEGGPWHVMTRDWWNTWRRSAQAQVWTPTDWQRLKMILQLVEQYHRAPDPKLMTEIRQNETLLGATPMDRLRARLQVTPPEPKARRADGPAPAAGAALVVALDERRARIANG